MKVFVFQGGLGNQIFCYAFYAYMKSKYPNQSMYGFYDNKKLGEHYGLEINKWFDVKLPEATLFSKSIVAINYFTKKIAGNHRWLDTSIRECYNEGANVFLAFKYTKKYLPAYGNWLKWKIDEANLSDKNIKVLQEIRSCNSFFIHVRRGDFLSEKYKKDYEGCCPLSYYRQAIDDVLSTEEKPVFFGFSDDIIWARENLPNVNINFIDWNTGTDSPLDMFLMSQCKGAIIANSTFSYWGAYLGATKKVYYPEKWVADKSMTPNIFFSNWTKY